MKNKTIEYEKLTAFPDAYTEIILNNRKVFGKEVIKIRNKKFFYIFGIETFKSE